MYVSVGGGGGHNNLIQAGVAVENLKFNRPKTKNNITEGKINYENVTSTGASLTFVTTAHHNGRILLVYFIII